MRENDLLAQNIERFCSRFDEPDHLVAGLRTFLHDFLSRQAVVVPLPAYGNIIHPVPEQYRYAEVQARIEADADIGNEFLAGLQEYWNSENLQQIPVDKVNETDPYWQNGFLARSDASALYSIVARYQPRRIIEMGVGNSTKFARKAINDHGLSTVITSIDPTPRANISGITDLHLECTIHDVDLELIGQLQANDILFLDGSHVSFCGTDVPFYFLNILPLVQPGVLVHIHDILLPDEYHAEFRRRHYNEQYMLAAMLLFSSEWEILLPVAYLAREGRLKQGGSSFWMRRK
ncbi:MAG: class I SAM-dependent methyltransferase [bacterium]